MSNSDELRKIQLLEKRLLGESQGNPQQFGQEMKEKSNEPGGNSHSHSGGTGETHETIRDQSNSLLLTNDIMTAHNGDENLNNQDRSKETNRGSGRSRSGNEGSSASNSRMSSVNVGTGQQVIELDKSDHSGSLSKISPLRPQGTDKDTMKSSTDQGKRKISSNGSSNAVLRDLNSVLKHVAGSEHGPVGVMNGAPTDGVPSPKAQKIGHEENTNGSSSITILENSGSKSGAIGGSVSNRRTIQSYFTQTGGSSSGAGNGTTSAAERDVRSPATLGDGENAMPNAQANVGGGSRKGNRGILGKNIANVTSTSSSSSSSSSDDLSFSEREARRQVEQLKAAREQASQKLFRMEQDLKQASDRQKLLEDRNIKIINALEATYRDMARQEGRRKRDRLALDCVRLGKIVTVRTGPTNYSEVWEEGYALKDLNKRSAEFTDRKDELHKRRSELNKARTKAKKKDRQEGKDHARGIISDDSNSSGAIPWLYDNENDLDLIAEAEAITSHLLQLKKDEIALQEERKFLEAEKAAHQKELKRCHSEDRSRFVKDLPCLSRRYLLTSLLGRGGFSEVWKAMDLVQLKEVAIKIHQLNPSWSEERKQSYIKHVTREYTIHRDMKHPRVVQLFDVFEIDTNCFATVLEYCRGIDLDEKLKRMRMLPEKDARTILLQIVSGLRYLNTGVPSGHVVTSSDGPVDSCENDHEVVAGGVGDGGVPSTGAGAGPSPGQKRMTIIHYDLKPANILFDEHGDAKITDFGLSKIVDDSNEDESLELTSQGAGTYWYLPPECFAKGDANGGPRVSNKVDVWSVGVIFYQMLFGRRPFGEGKSQEIVLREGIMLNANQVDFPSDAKAPKITDEAKDFIRACLTHDKNHRPDVLQLCMHPYISAKVKTT